MIQWSPCSRVDWGNKTTLMRVEGKIRFLALLQKSTYWVTLIITYYWLLMLFSTFWINWSLIRMRYAYLADSSFAMISLLTFWRRLHFLSYVIKAKPTWIMRFIVKIWWNDIVLRMMLVWQLGSNHLISPLLHYFSYSTILGIVRSTSTPAL